jgi:hypothetical protein
MRTIGRPVNHSYAMVHESMEMVHVISSMRKIQNPM